MLTPGGPTRNVASWAGGHPAAAIGIEDAGIGPKALPRPRPFVVPLSVPSTSPDD